MIQRLKDRGTIRSITAAKLISFSEPGLQIEVEDWEEEFSWGIFFWSFFLRKVKVRMYLRRSNA